MEITGIFKRRGMWYDRNGSCLAVLKGDSHADHHFARQKDARGYRQPCAGGPAAVSVRGAAVAVRAARHAGAGPASPLELQRRHRSPQYGAAAPYGSGAGFDARDSVL